MLYKGTNMDERISHITFENASAEVFCFDNGTEVREYHAMIHVTTPSLPFAKQLEAVLNAYDQLLNCQSDPDTDFSNPQFPPFFASLHPLWL